MLDFDALPVKDHRPIVQWVWDCDPTPQLLRRQMERVAQAGFGGLCIQPMPDDFRPEDFHQRMKIPYLGPAFFDAIRAAVTLAGELGLRIWLYDEGGWPSGQACGQVIQGHPHLRGQTLVQEAGRFIVEPTSHPDPLKLQATERFMKLTHLRYEKAVGDFFGNVIEAMFSDELKVLGCVGTDRIPWTDDLPEQFHKRRGYELAPVLGLLFEGATAWRYPIARIAQVRRDFVTLWIELFIERCFAPQKNWCHKNGLLLTGHMGGEHDLARHSGLFGDYLAVINEFDIPGVDTIWRQIWPGHRADFSLLAGSARVLHKRRFAMSETGAVYGRDIDCASLKWVCDHQIFQGINRFTLMNMPLSGDDEANISSLNLNGLPWEGYKQWTRHTATLSALTSQGRQVVHVGVLYPSMDLAIRGGDGPGTAAQAIVQELIALPGGCLYVDETALLHATTNDQQQVICGHASLHCLVIAGGSLISEALASKLNTLRHAGVQIIAVGESLPCALSPDGTIIPLSSQDITLLSFDAIAQNPRSIWPAYQAWLYQTPDTSAVRSMIRQGEDWTLLLLNNESLTTEAKIMLQRPEPGVCFKVDTTIQSTNPTGTHPTLTIPPAGVMAVVWGSAKGYTRAPLPGEPCTAVQPGDWTITAINDLYGGPMTLDAQTHQAIHAQPPGPWAATLGKHFSGQVVYTCKLVVSTAAPHCLLDLGRVEFEAQLRVNGQLVGQRSWAPYLFDLSGRLEPGINQIELTIGNTMANAWWSPEHVARRKAQGRWNIYDQRIEQRCKPALGGGLFGPIQWLDTSATRV